MPLAILPCSARLVTIIMLWRMPNGQNICGLNSLVCKRERQRHETPADLAGFARGRACDRHAAPVAEPPKPQPWKVTPVAAPSAAERASEPPKELAPGICSKCGRYIGRGMHFHVRSCDGKP